MPFSIFCVGNDDFHYSVGHVSTIGDVFDIRQAMDRISGGITDPVGTVRGEVRDAVAPPVDYVQDTMTAAGRISDTHILEMGLIAALSRMNTLRIAIAGRNPGWVITDSGFESHIFDGSDADPVRSFMRAFGPTLEHTGLNGLGVLGAIGQALIEFANSGATRLPDSGPGYIAPADYMLNISLTML